MNKTVNINIGGMIFHIDEDAFQKLTRYFEAIKRSLSNSSGQDEIMKDIEMRVAELLIERQKSDKHVINNKDVDEVITVMGQPEDYKIDDESEEKASEPFYSYTKSRKLYRDKDRGTIAGVCTGLGHYFGIDAVWLKILFLILFFGFGTGLIAYIILWIAMPKAVTTSEKLEMNGEPVTISSIEKKVRENFDNVSDKFKNADFDKMGNEIQSGANKFAGGINDLIMTIFKIFAKILGAIILVFSSLLLLGICIGSVVLLFSSSMPDNYILNHVSTPIGLETPLWIQGLLFLLAAGIPVFFFLILGLKLLVTNLKSIGAIAKYSLLGVWIIVLGVLISLGIKEATQIAYDGKDTKKEIINLVPNDTLLIKFKNNDFYSKENYHNTDFRLTQDENNKEIIYSNNVTIEIMKTDALTPYIQVERLAVGKSPIEAKNRANKIKYSYKIVGNQLILDNYLITDIANKFRDQKVELFLYLPKGTLFKADNTFEDYDRTDNDFFDLHFSSKDFIYKVDDTQIKCLNCPPDENEYNDGAGIGYGIDADSIKKEVILKINGKDIITKETTNKTTSYKEENKKINSKSKLTIDKNGVIIKTN